MCEYCDDVPSKYKGIRAEGFYQTAADDVYNPEIDVNFCPNCGRPLAEPKPLTLEERKQREDKPVWVKFDEQSEWCLIAHVLTEGYIGFYNSNCNYKLREFKDYKITWQAFDHEPHEVK